MKVLLSIAIGLLFVGCGKVTPKDLVGTWTNPDGASLILKTDGTFSAHALPAQVFLMPDSIDGPISGTGRWELEKHNLLWHGDRGEMTLAFNDMPGFPPRMGIEVIVSANGDLFQWKGEEGGERYEFKRK